MRLGPDPALMTRPGARAVLPGGTIKPCEPRWNGPLGTHDAWNQFLRASVRHPAGCVTGGLPKGNRPWAGPGELASNAREPGRANRIRPPRHPTTHPPPTPRPEPYQIRTRLLAGSQSLSPSLTPNAS